MKLRNTTLLNTSDVKCKEMYRECVKHSSLNERRRKCEWSDYKKMEKWERDMYSKFNANYQFSMYKQIDAIERIKDEVVELSIKADIHEYSLYTRLGWVLGDYERNVFRGEMRVLDKNGVPHHF